MSKYKSLYVRNPWNRRNISIVSILEEIDGKPVISFGWSFCSNHDKFIKRDGRALAQERLVSGDKKYSASVVLEKDKIRFFTIATEMLESIANSPNTPKKYLRDIENELYYFMGRINPHKVWNRIIDFSEKEAKTLL